MIAIRAFAAADVLAINLQPTQAVEPGTIDLDYGLRAAGGAAWTAIRVSGDGAIVVGCGGIVPVFATQGLAWALFARGIGHGMTAITRHARDAITASRFRRIEAIVRADWPQALRWAAAVGLRDNGLLRAWGPACSDHRLFERVR